MKGALNLGTLPMACVVYKHKIDHKLCKVVQDAASHDPAEDEGLPLCCAALADPVTVVCRCRKDVSGMVLSPCNKSGFASNVEIALHLLRFPFGRNKAASFIVCQQPRRGNWSGSSKADWQIPSPRLVVQIDVLAGHTRTGVSGDMSVNGRRVRVGDLQRYSCYVLQRDVLLATATVSFLCPPAYTFGQ